MTTGREKVDEFNRLGYTIGEGMGSEDQIDRHDALAGELSSAVDTLTAARKAAEPLRGALVSANNYRQISGSVPVLALIRILDAIDGKAGT